MGKNEKLKVFSNIHAIISAMKNSAEFSPETSPFKLLHDNPAYILPKHIKKGFKNFKDITAPKQRE